jgi:hypothetical protein
VCSFSTRLIQRLPVYSDIHFRGITLSVLVFAHCAHSFITSVYLTRNDDRKVSGRIRSRNVTPSPSSPQTSDVTHVKTDTLSTARPYRPSTQHLRPSPNFLSHRDEHIAEATSSVSPGTVNVVYRDQVNNITNYIHMNPDPIAGKSPSQRCRCLHRPDILLQKNYLYVVFDLWLAFQL